MSAVRRVLTVVLMVMALVSCDEDTGSEPVRDSAFPDLLGEQREKCERRGGRWGPAANKTSFACYLTLPDANKTCETGRDCQGLCLARSRTCSPITPFYGCHEVISRAGLPQTVCLE